jgi:protein-disulfide isomerase
MNLPEADRPTRLSEPVTDRDHFTGPVTAPVTILEYGDYECPDCFNAQPVLAEVRKQLGDKLRFVFRHFPQSSIHPHASAAAQAAEAAAEQGKFWPMHDALFAHQKELADLDLNHLALTLGLEIYRFDTGRDRTAHEKLIAGNHDSGIRSGVRGTPTLFINGERYTGKIDVANLLAISQQLLK